MEIPTDSLGLLQPIGITRDNQLVFGERRLLACRDHLGWTMIPARVVDVPSIVSGEYAENEIRKDFSPSEQVAIKRAVMLEIKAKGERRGRPEKIPAKWREFPQGLRNCRLEIGDRRGSNQYKQKKDQANWPGVELPAKRREAQRSQETAAIASQQLWGICPEVDKDQLVAEWPQVPKDRKTRDLAAKRAGFSSATTSRRAECVVEKGVPELVDAIKRWIVLALCCCPAASLEGRGRGAVFVM